MTIIRTRRAAIGDLKTFVDELNRQAAAISAVVDLFDADERFGTFDLYARGVPPVPKNLTASAVMSYLQDVELLLRNASAKVAKAQKTVLGKEYQPRSLFIYSFGACGPHKRLSTRDPFTLDHVLPIVDAFKKHQPEFRFDVSGEFTYDRLWPLLYMVLQTVSLLRMAFLTAYTSAAIVLTINASKNIIKTSS